MLEKLRQIGRSLRSATSRGDGRPFLEIQYHPSDIRRGVRYFFLGRRQVVLAWLAAFLWLASVGLGFVLLPSVIGDQLARSDYAAEMAERKRQGERLEGLLERFETLESSSEAVRIEMSKIYLAYGFSEDPARGKGGYPYEPERVPQSIYAASIRQGNGLHARIAEQFAVLEAFLDEVQSFESDHADQVRTTPSTSPLLREEFVLTSPFGMRTSPFTKEVDFHAGIDLAAPTGTPIYAPADGVVAFAGRYPLRQSVGWWRYGNLVVLRHGERFVTLYGHCDEVEVRSGQAVKQGDVIATVGDTGWSTNPHLHYEVRRRGDDGELQPVDPRIYILNHRWRDEERLLIRARRAPDTSEFEPLPKIFRR